MVLLLRDIYFIVLHLLVYSVTGLYLVAYSEAGVVFYITVYITAEGCCSKRGRLCNLLVTSVTGVVMTVTVGVTERNWKPVLIKKSYAESQRLSSVMQTNKP